MRVLWDVFRFGRGPNRFLYRSFSYASVREGPSPGVVVRAGANDRGYIVWEEEDGFEFSYVPGG